jgi:hypothetical protein
MSDPSSDKGHGRGEAVPYNILEPVVLDFAEGVGPEPPPPPYGRAVIVDESILEEAVLEFSAGITGDDATRPYLALTVTLAEGSDPQASAHDLRGLLDALSDCDATLGGSGLAVVRGLCRTGTGDALIVLRPLFIGEVRERFQRLADLVAGLGAAAEPATPPAGPPNGLFDALPQVFERRGPSTEGTATAGERLKGWFRGQRSVRGVRAEVRPR